MIELMFKGLSSIKNEDIEMKIRSNLLLGMATSNFNAILAYLVKAKSSKNSHKNSLPGPNLGHFAFMQK